MERIREAAEKNLLLVGWLGRQGCVWGKKRDGAANAGTGLTRESYSCCPTLNAMQEKETSSVPLDPELRPATVTDGIDRSRQPT